jgi:transcriptional regulator with XRE-family HTH domain
MHPEQPRWIEQKTTDNKTFFIELGRRIAQLRKEQGLTQQQLAEELGIAQQTLAHYEGARLRVPASMLPQFARLFGVAVDTLFGPTLGTKAKPGPAPKLQQHIERINQLPKAKQRFVMEMLDTALAQASR